jgi:D-glycero-alpha-D-manno-heptose-7-phosphate kinase
VIITRSPLRISLGGGGTDLPSYYQKHGGFLIAAAIDKYVYITIHRTFFESILLKYSEMEKVATVDEIRHPLIREALLMSGGPNKAIEIASMSDIPAGTGLGSSGSFTTALLYALYALKRETISKRDVAEAACRIEIERLGESVGKQDQYISAFGGITSFRFDPDGQVHVAPVRLKAETLSNLEQNLTLFFTGFSRSASAMLKDQDSKSRIDDAQMTAELHFVKQLGLESQAALERDDLAEFGRLLHVHWERKRTRSAGMSNPQIDQYYELARRNGALGGKLVGAGGGGFLMFYSEDNTKLRRALSEAGLREVRWRFDFEGTCVVDRT